MLSVSLEIKLILVGMPRVEIRLIKKIILLTLTLRLYWIRTITQAYYSSNHVSYLKLLYVSLSQNVECNKELNGSCTFNNVNTQLLSMLLLHSVLWIKILRNKYKMSISIISVKSNLDGSGLFSAYFVQ